MKQFAIIGCGAVSQFHAKAIQDLENGNLYGVYDTRRENAEKFASGYVGCKVFSTLDELFSCKEVDIVNICVPSGLHAELAIKAAKAGKHVIVEKPMAITKEQLDNIVQVAEENKTKIAVVAQLRFTPAIQKAKAAIDGGKLGKILLADFSGKYYRSPEYYAAGGWRGTWAMDGGGALMNQGIHGVDILLFLMGEVKRVTGVVRTLYHSIEVEDTVAAALEFECGALGTLCATTATPPGFDREIRIRGTRGSLIIKEHSLVYAVVDCKELPCSEHISSGGATTNMLLDTEGHRKQIETFFRAIRGEEVSYPDSRAGRSAVSLIRRIYEESI